MERNSNSLMLALYALPDPPDSVLVDRRDRAAVEEPEGSAAADGRGRGGSAEEDALGARLNHLIDAKRTGRYKGRDAAGEGLKPSVVDEARGGGAPHGVHADRRLGAFQEEKSEVDAGYCRSGAKKDHDHPDATPRKLKPAVSKNPEHGDVRRKQPLGAFQEEKSEVDAGYCCSGAKKDHDHPDATPRKLKPTVSKNPEHGDFRRKQPLLASPTARSLAGIFQHDTKERSSSLESLSGAKPRPTCGGGALHHDADALGDVFDHPVAAKDPCTHGVGNLKPPVSSKYSSHQKVIKSQLSEMTTGSTDCKTMQTSTASYEKAQHAPVTSARSSGVSSVQHQLDTPILDLPSAHYDPWMEILFNCGKVLSQPWKGIWEDNPLVLHDRQLVRLLPEQEEPYDIAEIIIAILNNHPGPIGYFRLETTKCTGFQLWKCVQKLSQKCAEEVVIINRGYDAKSEFPLEELQSDNLKRIRLGFFSLSKLDLQCFEYNRLDTLQLIGCTFETVKLYDVVKECISLTHLELGLSIKNVKLYSKSLRHLQIWRSEMRNFSIEFGPKLLTAVIGITPKEKLVAVKVNSTPLLEELGYLMLPFHSIEDHNWMNFLKKLKLGIQMASRSQRALMSQFLQSAYVLNELYIWRTDPIGPSEELDVATDESLVAFSTGKCLRSLRNLVIEDFRGGASEMTIARGVLKYAADLKIFRAYSYSNSSQEFERQNHIFDGFNSVDKASEKCVCKLLRKSI